MHTYTIVDAINDNNVLPFRIDYIDTVNKKTSIFDKQVRTIDREEALLDPERITLVTEYILEHFDQKTYRNQNRSYFDHRVITNIDKMASSKNNTVEEEKISTKVNGFNSILCVASISAAMAYYKEFMKQMEVGYPKLKIATIFSFSPNEEEPDGESVDDVLQDESFDTENLDTISKEFLNKAILDYNKEFKVEYDISADKFPNYYKDVSLRMKNREIDLLIVVNMFLTGFDATTLNTLWVDKNLQQHGLIQAFSRTNRILNSVKTFGNIVCFRPLEENTKAALSLFGNKQPTGMVVLKTYSEYLNGYTDEKGNYHQGYLELVRKLAELYPLGCIIKGEENQKSFIRLFSAILRTKNILSCFDEFINDSVLNNRDLQDYQSKYIDLYQDYAKKDELEKERINEDIVFEVELIKQVEVNIDYILNLVKEYHEKNCADKEVLVTINKAIDSSIALRSKKELVENFIKQMTVKTDIGNDWCDFVEKQKNLDLDIIIQDEKLKPDETKKFIANAFRGGDIKTTGTDIDKILPPVSRFSKVDNRAEKKAKVIEKLKVFYEKYFGLI